MPTLEHTVEIACPRRDVFAYLTEVENLPEWQATAVEARAEGPLEPGARVREVREFMGRRASSTLEVTAYEPPRAFALRVVEGPLRYEVEHLLEERDGGTRLRFLGRARLPAVLGLAARPMVKAAERQFVADLERLKEVLESA